jgi:hypothetical protein
VGLREDAGAIGSPGSRLQIPLARRAMRKVVSMRVLVVDDQDDFRMGMRSILEAEGFEVADAANAEDALERVIRFAPDVVLMDLHIPGISGIDATQRLLRPRHDLLHTSRLLPVCKCNRLNAPRGARSGRGAGVGNEAARSCVCAEQHCCERPIRRTIRSNSSARSVGFSALPSAAVPFEPASVVDV